MDDRASVEDIGWDADGTCRIGGALLGQLRALDRQLTHWAVAAGATEQRFSDLISIEVLRRVGYLASFPHLALVATPVAEDDGRRRAFAAHERAGRSGLLTPDQLAPAGHVLAPAACFQVYASLQGRELQQRKLISVCGTCYRNEATYALLQRQRAFSMREIVCIGSGPEVEAFLAQMAARSERFAGAMGLSVSWTQAADPFFDPAGDPRRLAQQLQPIKSELRYRGELALCSTNMHGDFFGEAFAIRRGDGFALSGCIAFGLERWLHALLDTHGPDCRAWPAMGLEE